MTTKLIKPVSRETTFRYTNNRPIVVTLEPAAYDRPGSEVLQFRPKGTQQKIRVEIRDAFADALRRAQLGR